MKRREFLQAGTLAVAAAGMGQGVVAAEASTAGRREYPLAIASYCYWHFKPQKVPITFVIERAAALGVQGVDVLHRQLESDANSELRQIKRHALLNGVALVCLSMHQDFVRGSDVDRAGQVEHTLHCLEVAARLGTPCMRVNAGRWGTIDGFDKLMQARGIEPLPMGVTEDDGYKRAVEGLRACVARAAELGVVMALENHWGLSGTPEGMLRIMREVDSPWLSLLPDTGNFLDEPYDKFEKVFPHACYIQAKTYFGGGEWYTLDLDYKRIIKQLRTAGYNGFIGIEFEGRGDPAVAVPQSIELLREAMRT